MINVQTQARSDYFGRINPVPVAGVCYWLLMLATGTDILNASLLATAIVFGLMAITAAGGIKTLAGFLNFVLIFKFLLLGVLLKILTLQPSDSNLRAPRTTAEVMAVGFFALYLGSVLYRHATKIKGVVKDVNDSGMYLALAIVFSIACLGSSFMILLFQVSYETNLSGGLWGIAHQFQVTSSFCVVPAMYYAWSSGSKRFLAHPLVLAILVMQLAIGFAGTTKQAIMEPILCYLAVGFIRYGIRSKAVWSIVAVGGFLYVSIVYPYSQYVRNHGGRDGSLASRLETIQEVLLNVATDSEFRQAVDSQISVGETYLGKEALRPISRLAMVGEADRLIAATDATQSYSGWDTIISGLRLMVPSFLMPDKTVTAGANFLGHIVGELAQDDMSTQVSYGFMANLYNAFGLYGVLFGTIIFIALFYYVVRLWFATPDLTFGPYGSSVWYVLLGMSFEHGLIEAPLGSNLPMFLNISAVVGLIYFSKLLASFLAGQRRTSPYY